MTLAARCPACGTVFRVVQDQLRVSEGWVRCGRCAEVFNAIESLVDLDADAAARPAQRDTGRDRVLDELARVARAGTPVREVVPAPTPRPAAPPTAAAAPAPAEIDFDLDAAEVEALRAEPALRTSPRPAPEFVRRAEEAARWRRPRVRAALGVVAIGAGVWLCVQVGIEYRDAIAARWPESRAVIEPLCAPLDCRVEAPRAIESLAVESSGLVRVDATSMYRLSLVLRNQSAHAIAAPAIDLTLTDSQGGAVARRVIRLAELGTRVSSIAGGAELPLQATLTSTERPLNGYTIEIFYP